AFLKEFMAAAEVTDQSASFLNQQGACGHIPLAQAKLPKGIEASGGNISQIQAGCAGAPDAGSLADQAAEHAQVVVQVVQLAVAEREAGAEQCAFQAFAFADTQATAIECCAASAAGGELFLAYRVDDDRVFQSATVLAGDADCIVGDAA